MKIIDFIKNWALIFSIFIGAIGYKVFPLFDFIVPYLLFGMLLFTFCRIDLNDIKFKKSHFFFLLIQLIGGIGIYFAIAPFNSSVAESMMMCLLAPTAAASAVVTMKLGGNAASNTTYVILSSIMVSIAAPLILPLIHPIDKHTVFLPACWDILKRVVPVLLGPFILAIILKHTTPISHKKLASLHNISFYLWAACLVFATAQTVEAIVNEQGSGLLEIIMLFGACLLCLLQFFIGKKIGSKENDEISGGQSLGQKNIVLAMWIAQSYLSHLALAGLGSYIVWQNMFNSYQLYKKRCKDEQNNTPPKFETCP